MQAKIVRVKSHKRKGRVVRAHGRVKKENRLKNKGQELVQALELSMEGDQPYHNSMQDVLKSVRLQNKIDNPVEGLTSLYKKVKDLRNSQGWSKEQIARSTKYLLQDMRHSQNEEKKAGRISLKQDLNSNFPHSFKRKKK